MYEIFSVGDKVLCSAYKDSDSFESFIFSKRDLEWAKHNKNYVIRAPFLQWCLNRTLFLHLAPPWKPISPSGLKLQNDDPYHSDWIIGAGLDPSEGYQEDIKKAAFNKMVEVQEEYCEFECGVIVDAGDVFGIVGEDIIVLPDLNPNHLDKIKNAAGIITEVGGKLAHLVQIALEQRITIMLVKDAQKRFVSGMKIQLKPSIGIINMETYENIL